MEVVVVDDASSDNSCEGLAQLGRPGFDVRVVRAPNHLGVGRARNLGAVHARGTTLLLTDSHVRLERGWHRHVERTVDAKTIAAAAIADPGSGFRGYGCELVVPFMGTHWNRERPAPLAEVQIPSAAATVISRGLYLRLGGYDPGMLTYGGAEPEFGVRAWLSGAQIVALPDLVVWHRFKPRPEVDAFIETVRERLVHNGIRFGLLYLSEAASLQMLRLYARQFPSCAQKGIRLVAQSDVWMRRRHLERNLRHDFRWFVSRFDLRDQFAEQIPL